MPLLWGLTFACTAAHADTPAQIFQRFAQCDDSFFRALPGDKQTLAPYLKLEQRNGVAAPQTEDGSYQTLSQPLVINGIPLLAYYNRVMSMDKAGDFLFWGFIAQGTPEQVQAALRPLVPDAERFNRQGKSWARVDIRRVGDPMRQWRTDSPANAGRLTPFGQVERILLVEPRSQKPPFAEQVSVFCSLQGTVTPPLIQVYRPDLDAHLLD